MASHKCTTDFPHLDIPRFRPVRRTLIRSIASTLVRTPIRCVPFAILSDPLHRVVDLARDFLVVRSHNTNFFEKIFKEKFIQRSREEQVRYLLYQRQLAASRFEYQKLCQDLDALQNLDGWKDVLEANNYLQECGYKPLILDSEKRKLDDAIADNSVDVLLRFFEDSFSRTFCGTNHFQLYAHTHFGTKALIDEYTGTILAAVATIRGDSVQSSNTQEEIQDRLNILEGASKTYGRTALTLSGGATLGMKHIGVVKALWEVDLLPKIICGTSAGSIVAAIVGCTPENQLSDVLKRFSDGDLAVFAKKDATVLQRFTEGLKSYCARGAVFDERHLERVMKRWLNGMTFCEAYRLTGRKLCIGVSAEDGKQPQLLNYKTAPDVLVWSAVCASCAVPMIFTPAVLYERCPTTSFTKAWSPSTESTKWIDGSLDADIPKHQLTALFGVKNFIVSQVNPHVRLFTGGEEDLIGQIGTANYFSTNTSKLRRASLEYLREAITGKQPLDWTIQQPQEWRIIRILKSILSQEYSGDINILPEISWEDLTRVFANPTPDLMHDAKRSGERATWRHLSQIRNSYAVELALDRTIRELQSQIHFGSSSEGESGEEETQIQQPMGRWNMISRLWYPRPQRHRRSSLSSDTRKVAMSRDLAVDSFSSNSTRKLAVAVEPAEASSRSPMRRRSSSSPFQILEMTSTQQPYRQQLLRRFGKEWFR